MILANNKTILMTLDLKTIENERTVDKNKNGKTIVSDKILLKFVSLEINFITVPTGI